MCVVCVFFPVFRNESNHTLSLGKVEVPVTFAALGALGDPSIQACYVFKVLPERGNFNPYNILQNSYQSTRILFLTLRACSGVHPSSVPNRPVRP